MQSKYLVGVGYQRICHISFTPYSSFGCPLNLLCIVWNLRGSEWALKSFPWQFHVIHCLSSPRERGLRNRQCAVEVLTLNSAQHYSLRDLTWKCCLGQAPSLLHIPGIRWLIAGCGAAALLLSLRSLEAPLFLCSSDRWNNPQGHRGSFSQVWLELWTQAMSEEVCLTINEPVRAEPRCQGHL